MINSRPEARRVLHHMVVAGSAVHRVIHTRTQLEQLGFTPTGATVSSPVDRIEQQHRSAQIAATIAETQWRRSILVLVGGTVVVAILLAGAQRGTLTVAVPFLLATIGIGAVRLGAEYQSLRMTRAAADHAERAAHRVHDEIDEYLDELALASTELRTAAHALGFIAPVGSLDAEARAVDAFLRSPTVALQRLLALAVLTAADHEGQSQPSEVPSA